MYCGFDIVVQEAINAAGANVENLLKLASAAQEAGNYQEAYDYFTKVLEYEANNHSAHLGKGICAAKLSTTEKFRFDELKAGLINAVNNAPGGKKEEIKAEAVNQLTSLCRNKRINKLTETQKTEALEIAHSFAPQNEDLLVDLIYRLSYWKSDKEKREKYLNDLQVIAPEKAELIRKSFAMSEIVESETNAQRKKDRKKELFHRKIKKSFGAIGEVSGIVIGIVIILVFVFICAICRTGR